MDNDVIFQPLKFRNLTVKNRLFRSNISGRFDNYDGSGTQTRINWEESFARGGVGAIISSFVPVHLRGRIMPNYAMIDSDDKIPFWRAVGEAVHRHDCKFIVQLSHSGRQRDNPGVENFKQKALSSTSRMDTFHGLLCEAMTLQQIKDTIKHFAEGARRAREAGLDGVELHASHGYLITQFLSSAINDRKDQYGGVLQNRAAFLLEIIHAIRKEVGDDYHLQAKLNAVDFAQCAVSLGEEGQHARRRDSGREMGGGSGRGRDPRFDRQHLPSSAAAAGRLSSGRAELVVRHDDFERRAGVFQLHDVSLQDFCGRSSRPYGDARKRIIPSKPSAPSTAEKSRRTSAFRSSIPVDIRMGE